MRVVVPHCGIAAHSRLGGEVYERRLLEALPSHGVEIEIGLPAAQDPSPVAQGWTLVRLRPSRGQRWYLAPLTFVPYVARRLRAEGVDLLRAHSVRFVLPSLLFARRLARSRVPIVVHHLHTDPGWRWLETPLLRRADLVITISEFSRRQLLEQGVNPKRVRVILPGHDTPPPADGDESHRWPAAPRLLFLGQLIARKQPELALRTLSEMRKTHPAATLAFAGAGQLAGSLRSLADELGLGEAVTWIDDVDDHLKWGLYRGADVVLFTSRLEGFGLVAAEAQACGTPVVVVEGTAAAEFVRDGLSGAVAAGEPAAYAEAVRRCLGREDLREGAREVAASLTWERCARAVADAYGELVRAPGRGAVARRA